MLKAGPKILFCLEPRASPAWAEPWTFSQDMDLNHDN